MGKAIETVYPEGVYVAPKKSLFKYIVTNKWLYIMLIPALLYVLIYNYVPMFGIVMAFQDFSAFDGFSSSEFIGFENFQTLFDSAMFGQVFKNSVLLSFYNLLFGFPFPILFAILLNELKQDLFKRFVQTVSYLPHFISWVVIAGMLLNYLNSTGPINFIIGKFGGDPIMFLQSTDYFRGVLVFAGIWKGVGWSSIVYLAALSGLDQQVYEAALIDGANRFQRILHITLPGIMSTVVTVLILNMGTVMNNGFDQVFLLQNPMNREVSETFETYTYVLGIMNGKFGLSTALGLFKSVVSFVLVMSTNFIARKIGQKGLW